MNLNLINDIFNAYYDCRRNKRNSLNALTFEFNYESRLLTLCNEIEDRNYEVSKSTVFIIRDPVKREIFAANFRDRVVHHYIISKLMPFLERVFIFDSYSCRDQKWTSFWIKRIIRFLRSCSDNYTKDCYILKLDIEGFFMNIDKDILKTKTSGILNINPELNNNEDLVYLVNSVIDNDPIKNFILKWNRSDWIWLPKNKSLFYSKTNCWLPIWNLSSQVFANLYLHELDIFIKKELKIKYYWRYVDDFVLIYNDKEYLKVCVSKIKDFLSDKLRLNLHPKKIYLQHYSKWVKFLWAYIKPYRSYIWNRTKWNFYKKIQEINKIFIENNNKIDKATQNNILSIINSYLWLLRHHNTYNLRKKMLLENINWYFWNYFYISDGYRRIKKKMRM